MNRPRRFALFAVVAFVLLVAPAAALLPHPYVWEHFVADAHPRAVFAAQRFALALAAE